MIFFWSLAVFWVESVLVMPFCTVVFEMVVTLADLMFPVKLLPLMVILGCDISFPFPRASPRAEILRPFRAESAQAVGRNSISITSILISDRDVVSIRIDTVLFD